MVLVDYRVDPVQAPAAPHDGDAAAAARDRDRPVGEQRADRAELDHLEGRGRGNDAAPASARFLPDGPAALALELPRPRLVVEGADRLRGLAEGGVVLGDANVGEEAGDRPAGDGLQLGRDQRADLRLSLGDGEVERNGRYLVSCQLLPDEHLADLGPVAMGDDDLVLVEQGRERGAPLAEVRPLLGGGAPLVRPREGVAAERDDGRHTRALWPMRPCSTRT